MIRTLKLNIKNKNFQNGTFGGLMHIIGPLLMVLTTPILLSSLGVQQYGVWVLIQTLIGFLGVMQFGLGDAMIKYISQYRAVNDYQSINRIINCITLLYFLFAIIAALILYLISPIIVKFLLDGLNNSNYIFIVKVTSISLFFSFMLQNNLSIFKGYERYDIASIVMMVHLIGVNTTSILLIFLGFGLLSLVIGLLVNVLLVYIISTIIVYKKIGFNFKIITDFKAYSDISSFSLYAWLHSLAGIVFSYGDRFVVSGLLGTSSLAYYSISIQVASQAHSLLAKVFSYVFPMISKLREKGLFDEAKSIYFKYMNYTIISSLVLGLIIYIFSFQILEIWLGFEFAENSYKILQTLSLVYAVMGSTIIPHYFLNGFGYVKFNALFGWVLGLLSLLLMLVMIPIIGIFGAALARLLGATLTQILTITIMHYFVLKDRRITVGAVFIFIIISPFVLLYVLDIYLTPYSLSILIPFMIIGFIFVFNKIINNYYRSLD
jgi:O-antigen/teichoic acid export membrane protein